MNYFLYRVFKRRGPLVNLNAVYIAAFLGLANKGYTWLFAFGYISRDLF